MKKILGIILSVAMMLTMMPTMAFANESLELNCNEDAGLWVSPITTASTFEDIYNGFGLYKDVDEDSNRYYFYEWNEETEVASPWTLGTSTFKILNEKGKNCTSKFVIAEDQESGLDYLEIKSERTTGNFALTYKGVGGHQGVLWFDANMWDDVRKEAQANKATVKAKAAKKSATLTLSYKGMYEIDGYQIYKSAKKTTGFKKAATTSNAKYTLKNLKSKKTSYVKVRTYKVYNGKTYYGKWSKVVKVKAK